MIEIRMHGRGGQGAVKASFVLAEAAFQGGKYVQAFPRFGVERRGAPVEAFTRIDDKPVQIRSQIYYPDGVIVLDPTLTEVVDVTKGLKKGGWILINSNKNPEEYDFGDEYNVYIVDATDIAVQNKLGSRSAPIVNTAIVGAFAKITGLVEIDAVYKGIENSIPRFQEENKKAAKQAYDSIKSE
ncbi:MAG TPA: pyruvate ferredoxin oxidoreductase subunit gamma [Candidatus Cloacimonetes bacterium]|nr:pyruvate ferredoxin oxidoreductase subunit gamma [Candidatus Cloacimonadota bacterium]HEX37297.1 pyruvate ferredoxin oxidoreductase subunit gamma [Candidatus Cloacimonadota bacterium]